MEIYLVGGAVRDSLLNLNVSERDWVVTGATPEELLSQGYHQVGKDFPVFLHPVSHEEYALARTERKSGSGYTGFVCHSTPEVTLTQDLLRRDLTINAIARSMDGQIIDPYQGRRDLENRVLRHVSEAFSEDPVRLLRVARFAARFAHLGFSIAAETSALMNEMVTAGELSALVPERVWKETEKALLSQSPQLYFQVLRDCGALRVLFPEIDQLFGVPAPEKWHPEIDTGIHTLMTVAMAAQISEQLDIRFAALCHDLGKGLTPKEKWPHHPGHGKVGVKLIEQLCLRLHVPGTISSLAKLVAEYHDIIHNVYNLQPQTLLKLFDAIDVWRKPWRLEQIIATSEADARGRTGFENAPYPQGDYLRLALHAAKSISIQDVIAKGIQGQAISNELQQRRLAVLTEWKKNQPVTR